MTTNNGTEPEICPNCRRPIPDHRPWCSTYVTRAEPPKVGDVYDDPVFGPTPLISVYLRQEAISDGVLVDCTEGVFDKLNRNAGLIFDVVMTRAVFERYVEVPHAAQGMQDVNGRYWDLISMYHRAAQKSPNSHELLFEFLSVPNGSGMWENERPGSAPNHHLVQLKVISGPSDQGEPCLTFMLPSED